MRPKTLCIEPSQLDTARRILDATTPKRQTWICSNCGLKRTFHRVSRVHYCQQQNLDGRQQGQGIWRKATNSNFPRVTIWPPTEFFQATDYLIWLKTNTVVIIIDPPQPFSIGSVAITTPNRSRSKHLCR